MRERVREEPHIPISSTIFVDNLPHRLRKIWVYNLFPSSAKINYVFIPNKKSKISSQSFGFVRFNRFNKATWAIANTDNRWVWGHRLAVNFARFFRKEDIQDELRGKQRKFAEQSQSNNNHRSQHELFQLKIQIPKAFHRGFSEKN